MPGWLVVVALALVVGCGSAPGAQPEPTGSRAAQSSIPTSAVTARPRPVPPTGGPAPSRTGPVVVRYRVERRTTDAVTAGFARAVAATLSDPRGWQRGDVRLVRDQRSSYTVVLVEPREAQRLCWPYDVYRKYSCQNGPMVVLNADRWRNATPEWTGTLTAYRQMLVNHEFGHLLGLHHPPAPQCPGPGELAPIMAQQSTELGRCRPNPWPLAREVARLARHDLPLAPPPD